MRTTSPLNTRHVHGQAVQGFAAPEDEVIFELVQDIHIGGSAMAKVIWWDGDEWMEAPEWEEIELHDAIGTFEGVFGDRGYARFHRQSGKWIVIQLKC